MMVIDVETDKVRILVKGDTVTIQVPDDELRIPLDLFNEFNVSLDAVRSMVENFRRMQSLREWDKEREQRQAEFLEALEAQAASAAAQEQQ